ncbi:MAG: 4Fe-4S binding protein [Muribaculum sp.]|nr:4Fe-4S binding protein [Muribaculum sp.]
MLRKIRQILAIVSIIMVTLLFLDFTGTLRHWFGWMAKIQFLPALLALNVGVIVGLVLLTLVFGRVYCSVICPLGIMQDGFGAIGKRLKKNRYTYSKPLNILRYSMLAIMALSIILGIGVVVALLAPYSAYGRIAQSMLAPIWIWGNNLLAGIAESHDSYALYTVDVWLKGGITLAVAVATLVILAVLAYRNGRTYCNAICPVGTVLGLLSRFSFLKPVINTDKCINCKLCERNCKASCIDISGGHKFDYSRCVACFDCIDKCPKGAISYKLGIRKEELGINAASDADSNHKDQIPNSSLLIPNSTGRRQFLTVSALVATGIAMKAEEKVADGGLAEIIEKKRPSRNTKIVPPGALSIKNLEVHCTACQLCVSVCPNGVLRPSTSIDSLMQPESSYEIGYCRPECVECSNACPTGAIRPISREDKSAIQIGHAVWVKDNCVVLTDDVDCGNCARHCPVGAITMVPSIPGDENSRKIPAVNTERCIGCGACENLCPARPFSAIYVEGHEIHREV